jgi:hypothetical protein
MPYRVLADTLMVLHFGFVLFMLLGFVLTVRGLWRPRFFDRWIFRTVHLAGILYVGSLAARQALCPLTIWEYQLRRQADPTADFPGSFIIHWVERLLYPDVPLIALIIPTLIIAIFTLVMYIWRPPRKVRDWVGRVRTAIAGLSGS